MAETQTRLARLESWLDQQNARDDAKNAARPAWWHVGKIALGLSVLARGASLCLVSSAAHHYFLGTLYLVVGASLVITAAESLRRRSRAASK